MTAAAARGRALGWRMTWTDLWLVEGVAVSQQITHAQSKLEIGIVSCSRAYVMQVLSSRWSGRKESDSLSKHASIHASLARNTLMSVTAI